MEDWLKLGISGGALGLLWWGLKEAISLLRPIAKQHLQTMQTFSAQFVIQSGLMTEMAEALKEIRTSLRRDRGE